MDEAPHGVNRRAGLNVFKEGLIKFLKISQGLKRLLKKSICGEEAYLSG